jgi:hypothetical protein
MQSMIHGYRWAAPHNFPQARPTETPRLPTWALPPDLRLWVSPDTLISWIREAVSGLDWAHPLVTRYLQNNPDFRPRAMLEFLAYAYATRVSGSEEILASCRCEPALMLLCEGNPPFRQEIIAFRRGNRKVLERVLSELYRRAIAVYHPGARSHLLLNAAAEKAAIDRLNCARHMDAVE